MNSLKFKLNLVLGILIVLFCHTACNSDDNLSDSELFTGTYTGTISYADGEEQFSVSDAPIQVVQVDENYSFHFTEDVPSIENIEMISDGSTLMNPDATETHLIRVTPTSIQIIWSEGSQNWDVQGSRSD